MYSMMLNMNCIMIMVGIVMYIITLSVPAVTKKHLQKTIDNH